MLAGHKWTLFYIHEINNIQQITHSFRCTCSLGYFFFLINLVKDRPFKLESNNLKEQYRATYMLKQDFPIPVL